jgi:hypothetical protein
MSDAVSGDNRRVFRFVNAALQAELMQRAGAAAIAYKLLEDGSIEVAEHDSRLLMGHVERIRNDLFGWYFLICNSALQVEQLRELFDRDGVKYVIEVSDGHRRFLVSRGDRATHQELFNELDDA